MVLRSDHFLLVIGIVVAVKVVWLVGFVFNCINLLGSDYDLFAHVQVSLGGYKAHKLAL